MYYLQTGDLQIAVSGFVSPNSSFQYSGNEFQQLLQSLGLIIIWVYNVNGQIHIYTIGWQPVFYSLQNACRVNIYFRLWTLVQIQGAWLASEVMNIPVMLKNTGGQFVGPFIPLHLLGFAIANFPPFSSGSQSYTNMLASQSNGAISIAPTVPTGIFPSIQKTVPYFITLGFEEKTGNYTLTQPGSNNVTVTLNVPVENGIPSEVLVNIQILLYVGEYSSYSSILGQNGLSTVGAGVNANVPVMAIVYFDTQQYIQQNIVSQLNVTMQLYALIWVGISTANFVILPEITQILQMSTITLPPQSTPVQVYPTPTVAIPRVLSLITYAGVPYIYNQYFPSSFNNSPSLATENGVSLVAYPTISQMTPISESNVAFLLSNQNADFADLMSVNFGLLNLTPQQKISLANQYSYMTVQCQQKIINRPLYEQCIQNANNNLNNYRSTSLSTVISNLPIDEILVIIGGVVLLLVGTLSLFATGGASAPISVGLDVAGADALGQLLLYNRVVTLPFLQQNGLTNTLVQTTVSDNYQSENSEINTNEDNSAKVITFINNNQPFTVSIEGTDITGTVTIQNDIADFNLTITLPSGNQIPITVPTGVINDYTDDQGYTIYEQQNQPVRLKYSGGQVIYNLISSVAKKLDGFFSLLKRLLTYIGIALLSVISSILINIFLFMPLVTDILTSIIQSGQGIGSGGQVTFTGQTSNTVLGTALNNISATFGQIPQILEEIPVALASAYLITDLLTDFFGDMWRGFTKNLLPNKSVNVNIPQPLEVDLKSKLNAYSEAVISKNDKGEWVINKKLRGRFS
jgi:hypothetical protein